MIVEGSGTITADGTVQTLLTSVKAALFVFIVDTAFMQSGDTLVLMISTKVLTISRGAYQSAFFGAQFVGDEIKFSVPVPSDVQAIFTLQQTSGVNRSYDWKVLSL